MAGANGRFAKGGSTKSAGFASYHAAERAARSARGSKDHIRKVYGGHLDRLRSASDEVRQSAHLANAARSAQGMRAAHYLKEKPKDKMSRDQAIARHGKAVRELQSARADFAALRRSRSRDQNRSGLQRGLFG